MSHLILPGDPLFVFLGLLIEMTGMARAMVDFWHHRYVRGGLSTSGGRDVSSRHFGIKAADGSGRAGVVSRDDQRGSQPGDLVGLLAATGAQTDRPAESLVLITIGSVTGVSIGALFTGGLLPSLVLAVGCACCSAALNQGHVWHSRATVTDSRERSLCLPGWRCRS
jgi:TRAP-type C4-dicarboxylate transport system permease large subunit